MGRHKSLTVGRRNADFGSHGAGAAERGIITILNFVDVLSQAAAKVGRFVFRDDVLAAETLKKGACLVVGLLCLCFVGHLADTAHCCTSCFCPVAVLKLSCLRLANSF